MKKKIKTIQKNNRTYNFYRVGLVDLNAKGKIRNLNLLASEFLGIEPGHAKNKNFIDFIKSAEAVKFKEFLHLCKKRREELSGEFKIQNSRSKDLNIHLVAVPYRINRTGEISLKIYFHDITDRKEAENTLNETEKQFRLMADNSPVMIWMTDSKNNLQYMNKTKLEFLGKSFAELTNEGWMETRHPDDREKFLSAISNAAKERKNFSIEIRVKDKKGNYRWLLDSGAPRFLPDGTFAGFIGSGVDITNEKNLRIVLEKSLKEKDVLLKEIHHRVKNNLQVVSSLLNLQTNLIKDEDTIQIFKASQNRVRSMAILHEKLYKSKNMDELNIKKYLEDLLSYLFESYSHSQNIKLYKNILNINLNIELGLCIGLIVNELVSNSLKHAFKGKESGEITVELKKIGKDNIVLSVKDNGIGINEKKNLENGESLGLMLVRTLSEQYNGSMEVNVNGKTEFIIQLQYESDNRPD
jgi:PAS domain S-box-containing protein